MSYEFQATLHRSPATMCAAIAYEWVSAGGNNNEADIAEAFSASTDDALTDEVAYAWGLSEPDNEDEPDGDTWMAARDVDRGDIAAAFAALRAARAAYAIAAANFRVVEYRGQNLALTQDAYPENYGTEGHVRYYALAIDAEGRDWLVAWDTTSDFDARIEAAKNAIKAGEHPASGIDESSACEWDDPADATSV